MSLQSVNVFGKSANRALESKRSFLFRTVMILSRRVKTIEMKKIFAAAAMAFSSLSIALNSLCLKRAEINF